MICRCAPQILHQHNTYLSEVNLQPKSFLALTLTCTYPAIQFCTGAPDSGDHPHARRVPRRHRVLVAGAAALRQSLPRHAAGEHPVRRGGGADQATARETPGFT